MLGRTTTLSRYRAESTPPSPWSAIEGLTFERLPTPSSFPSKRSIVGWCSAAGAMIPFDRDRACRGSWVHFGVRIDTWSAPASTLRATLQLRIHDWLQESGRERVPAAVKQELKEAVHMELARASTRHVEVLWNLLTDVVLIGSAVDPVRGAIEVLWSKTFGGAELRRHVDEHFGSPRFLTWLWWRIDSGETEFRAVERDWTLWLEEQIKFEGSSTVARIATGSPSQTRTAFAALTSGLKPSSVRLGFDLADGDMSCFVDRPADVVRSLRLASATDTEEGFEDRTDRIELVLGLLDGLAACYGDLVADEESLTEVEGEIQAWKAGWDRTLAPASTDTGASA